MFEKDASPEFKRHAFGIIVIGCLAMYFSCCLSTDALNILQPVFTELGWSYSKLSMPLTVAGYILVALSFVFSTFIMKNGTRIFGTFAFGAMAVGTLLVAIAYASNNYAIYFVGGVLSRFGCVATQTFIFQLCAEWFEKTRGRILGIITMAAPLNSATSTTLLTLANNKFGFTATYIIMAAVLGVSTILAFMFSQTRPSEMGMTPDGIDKVEKDEVKQNTQKTFLSMKQVLTLASTWKITIAFGIFNGTIGAIMAFFITRMTEVQVDISVALIVLSVASVLGIPISYLYGWIDDKYGTIKACTVLGVMYVVLCVCLYFSTAGNMWLIVIAAIGMASMTGGCPNLHPSAIMYTFGTSEYQNANRYIGIGISLISTFGVQLMSTCMDKTGSLNTGYIVFGVLTLVATILIATTKKVDVDKLKK